MGDTSHRRKLRIKKDAIPHILPSIPLILRKSLKTFPENQYSQVLYSPSIACGGRGWGLGVAATAPSTNPQTPAKSPLYQHRYAQRSRTLLRIGSVQDKPRAQASC